jgi:2-keto-4-pentenoate hydratase
MSSPTRIEKAAQQLVEAHRTGNPLKQLDLDAEPESVADALATQATMVELLGETVAGWKVAVSPEKEFMYGVVLGSRRFTSPARVPNNLCPMRGIEVEVAFRFMRDLNHQDHPYTDDEVWQAVEPFIAIEIVDSRYANYAETHWRHRLADFMSNGAFIVGNTLREVDRSDLAELAVKLIVNGSVLVEKKGGHPAGDPFAPVVRLVNKVGEVKAGQFVTTGTFTGMISVAEGSTATGQFDDTESVTVTFI